MQKSSKNEKYALKAILLMMVFLALPTIVFGITAGNTIRVKTISISNSENSDISGLNREINDKKESIKKIQEQQQAYLAAIEQKRSEKNDLNNQLSILENRISQNELEISKTETDIDRVNLEIKKTTLEIDAKEQEISAERKHIENILKLMHKKDSVSSFEVILLNDSFSEYLNQIKYLEDINIEVKESLEKLKVIKQELEENKIQLNLRNEELVKLKQDLEDKKLALQSELENKKFLLEQTELSESNYQRLLVQARVEQEQAASDITSLEKAVRDKMSLIKIKRVEFNDQGFIWPVPKNVITATFHDPDYPFRNIFEHPAVDVRAGQGTPIKAAASGYVARAKDGGKGYSYIMLVHADGLSTVYGHVSKLLVADDDFVLQGQLIGYSGGLPGTPGAGSLTTGPHLHFEVRLNGIPVNPLEYLP